MLDRLPVAAGAEMDAPRRLAPIRRASDLALAAAAIAPLLLQVSNWGARQGIAMVPRIDRYTLAVRIRPAD